MEVGTRVRVAVETVNTVGLVGRLGTVVTPGFMGDWQVGVRLDEQFKGGHDLLGHCEWGYGRYFTVGSLEEVA